MSCSHLNKAFPLDRAWTIAFRLYQELRNPRICQGTTGRKDYDPMSNKKGRERLQEDILDSSSALARQMEHSFKA